MHECIHSQLTIPRAARSRVSTPTTTHSHHTPPRHIRHNNPQNILYYFWVLYNKKTKKKTNNISPSHTTTHHPITTAPLLFFPPLSSLFLSLSPLLANFQTGGGIGGKKESGQIRFGGRDRPFKKPFTINRTPGNRYKFSI